jgi:PAS domain S-box-containing protein
VRSRDEVGDLTEAFNSMSGAIRQKLTELQAGNDRLHAIADYTYGWENWFAPDGKLLWVNPSVERLTGYTPAECQAMADFPFSVIVAGDIERTRAEFQIAARGGTGSNFEFRVRRKDGSEFWAAAAWQPIYGAHHEFLGHRSSIWDVSERKQFGAPCRRRCGAGTGRESTDTTGSEHPRRAGAPESPAVRDEHRHPVRG